MWSQLPLFLNGVATKHTLHHVSPCKELSRRISPSGKLQTLAVLPLVLGRGHIDGPIVAFISLPAGVQQMSVSHEVQTKAQRALGRQCVLQKKGACRPNEPVDEHRPTVR